MRTIKVWLNGSVANNDTLADLASALSTPGILREKGGYLFKAGITDEILHIGVIPAFTSGERGHHYDINIPADESAVLVGTVSAVGMFTLLFKPASLTELQRQRQIYARIFSDLAACLVESGFKSEGTLDDVTKQLLASSNLFAHVPSSIAEIALLRKH